MPLRTTQVNKSGSTIERSCRMCINTTAVTFCFLVRVSIQILVEFVGDGLTKTVEIFFLIQTFIEAYLSE